jgi:alkylated DNA nucleotide flippase Atl1
VDTNVRTPQEVFYLPQHLVVPLFQRPYVWNEVDQWQPLWTDMVRMAELRLKEPHNTARHFLGAIVLQASSPIVGTVPTWNIIDGQQRITTLQLLTDATSLVLEERGLDSFAQQLGDLTHNRAYFGEQGRSLKLIHTNRDGTAFTEVMDAEPPVDHTSLTHSGALISRGHAFFANEVALWIDDDAEEHAHRAAALTSVITQGLQLVVIDLRADENSQEIFETLNARGTPLTAADLIKNFVFQKLESEGVDVARAYAEDWPFESPFWEEEISVGRYPMSRGSLFLSQWLQSRVGEEIGPRQTFVRFKYHVDHEAGASMSELLQLIKKQAETYASWVSGAADPTRALTVPERAFYRMQASGVELLKPALIWLHDPTLAIPESVADEVTVMLESWIVRRQILRLTSASLGRVIPEIVKAYRTTPADVLAVRVRDHLTRQNAASNYWPGDEEIRQHLTTEQAFRRYPRPRMRMFLEAVEDQLRSTYKTPNVPRIGFPIEHILPQSWQQHWPVEGLQAEVERAEHVHRLGNLTLITTSLNSNISNSNWATKRKQLDSHDAFLINRAVKQVEQWDETSIDERTAAMIEALLATWPVPAGHIGQIADAVPTAEKWVEIKHLLAADLVDAGTVLTARPGNWANATATITANGQVDLDGTLYDSPSAAARVIRGGSANGWQFWRLADGRPLADIRAAFRGEKPSPRKTAFDWSTMHAILEALPAGRWTSYAELADAVGTAPQPVGTHITNCPHCANPWRVLTWDGRIADQFAWSDPNDNRDPRDLLLADGVRLVDGKADPEQLLRSDALIAFVSDSTVDPPVNPDHANA